MKNTSQIIGVHALLTFVILAMPPQQMFAFPSASSKRQTISPCENGQWKAIIFTEIMADPSPPQGLPEVEYVELFNRTSLAVSLAGWHLSDAASAITLPEVILQPHQYLVVTAKENWLTDSNVVIIANVPSLNNTGDSLALTDPAGNVIDILNYSDDWYRDSQRSDGGWSLELIDPENTCEAAGNWNVTEDPLGGTPGKQNSIFATNPDVTGPHLISAQPLNDVTLRLVFNEKLAAGALTSGQWMINPALDVLTRSFGDSSRTSIDLHLNYPMRSGVLYSLSLLAVLDCAGNRIQESKQTYFALPESANRGDVVINEVLFDPPPDGVDFVELYNASQKYINLNGWAIGSMDEDGNVQKTAIGQVIIIRPNAYVAFSADRVKLQSHFDAPDTVLAELKLPSYPDDDGAVILFNEVDSIIDRFAYAADMHNVFVRDPEGVALERISPSDRSDERSNWTSASSLTGFGTPGRKNSAARGVASSNDRPVRVTPSVFTPFAGLPNAAEISYHFDLAGYVGTVNICDNRGVIIRRLANNALLATEGVVRWEGDRDDGLKAQSGYYLVWFQVFASDGVVRVYREPVAVSPRY
ncbi:MAG TPA: lamin tail domain-containing protein [Chryseolinea sp.]|nr:lamin tail domain-containing protein [Chryseolinea sp.]